MYKSYVVLIPEGVKPEEYFIGEERGGLNQDAKYPLHYYNPDNMNFYSCNRIFKEDQVSQENLVNYLYFMQQYYQAVLNLPPEEALMVKMEIVVLGMKDGKIFQKSLSPCTLPKEARYLLDDIAKHHEYLDKAYRTLEEVSSRQRKQLSCPSVHYPVNDSLSAAYAVVKSNQSILNSLNNKFFKWWHDFISPNE